VANARHYQILCAEVIRLLQKERERRSLSKYSISKRSGVSQSMLSLVERGLRNPTLEVALRIADGIGVDLCSIIRTARKNLSSKLDVPISPKAPL
jgi:transcriptional regulator with XRE-family HTH domain